MSIEFTNKPTKWENEGAPPSSDLKTKGFQAGYKPPAGIFNHHWHETAECIDELQNKVSELDDTVSGKGNGDMLKNVYDTDKSGVVDNSERLGGEKPDYYTNISNLKQQGGYVIFNCGSATEVI